MPIIENAMLSKYTEKICAKFFKPIGIIFFLVCHNMRTILGVYKSLFMLLSFINFYIKRNTITSFPYNVSFYYLNI